MSFRAAGVFVLLGAAVPGLGAQVPAGGEFRVNDYTTFNQSLPSTSADPDGRFVVTWISYSQDGSDYGVFARHYQADGTTAGSEFQVNSYTTYRQVRPSTAQGGTGDFVLVWESWGGQDGRGRGAFAQRYAADGSPRGLEFQVNTYTTSDQYRPRVAADANGHFVVVWQSFSQDGSNYAVEGQRFEVSGTRRGGEFQINAYTTSLQWGQTVASDPAGNFVVVWMSEGQDGSGSGVFGQRFDAAGLALGAEFSVNSYTTAVQERPRVAVDADGNFVVAWAGQGPAANGSDVFARRYSPAGEPIGLEWRVNSYTTGTQGFPWVAAAEAGDFIIAWASADQDGEQDGAFLQRYEGSGLARGAEFRVNTYTTSAQSYPAVSSDETGNFVVAWRSLGQDESGYGIFAQRFGGLLPQALVVDVAPSPGDGNRVLDPGETASVRPSWRNLNGAAQTIGGDALSFSGPPAAGVTYERPDAAAGYGTIANGASAACIDCYELRVGFSGTRPSPHWDAVFTERLTPDAMGQTKRWRLHVGSTFADVSRASPFYPFVEALVHASVTGGCGVGTYCPASAVSREQVAVFALVAKEGPAYLPPACGPTPVFGDVPASSPFCRWIEELSRRGVVSGCGGGNYCPTDAVAREQMPVFMLRVADPTFDPPPCGTPIFSDVPASSPFCRWIEELARRGVVSGCGGGNYCPGDPVTREQMAVFVIATFGLGLYGP